MNKGPASQGLDFLTKHFAVLSGAAVLAASTLAIVFLYSYLAVFDWRLIWLVEYGDVFKVALVALGLMSSMAFAFRALTVFSYDVETLNQMMVIAISIAIIVGVILVFVAWRVSDRGPLVATMFSLLISMLFVGYRISMVIAQLPNVSSRYVLDSLLSVVLMTIVLGNASAWYALLSERFKYDVTLKTEIVQDAALVMTTARHTILFADDKAIVVPTAEVIKLEGRSTPRTKIECAAAEAC